MNSETPFGMTELEDQLLSQEGKMVMQRVLVRLDALEGQVGLELEGGTTPARFNDLNTIRSSLVAARRLMLTFRMLQM